MFKALQLSKSEAGVTAQVVQLDPALLESMIEEIAMEAAVEHAGLLMAGKVRGRVVVRIG